MFTRLGFQFTSLAYNSKEHNFMIKLKKACKSKQNDKTFSSLFMQFLLKSRSSKLLKTSGWRNR